ncbi:hypothetical protein EDB89DRAFT_787328 [Lactarius sanguifluus]|nr:hypothetical protein EDB89DRAFT_787328 [Lactarius sanguifluus]
MTSLDSVVDLPSLNDLRDAIKNRFGFFPCTWQLEAALTQLKQMDLVTMAPGSSKTLTFWMPLLFNGNGITVVTPLIVLSDKYVAELLLSALCATLVQQLARQYTQAFGRLTEAHQRARVHAFLLQGIERSGVKAVVEGAPALLHLAMFLFIAGLIDIIAPASRMLSLLSSSVLVVITAFYPILSWFPLHDLQSPYCTPFSKGWHVVVDSRSHSHEQYATMTIDGPQERDLASLSWALSSLIDRGDWPRSSCTNL